MDWTAIRLRLEADGYALLPALLTNDGIDDLRALASRADCSGGNRVDGEALPEGVSSAIARLREPLATIATQWTGALQATVPALRADAAMHVRSLAAGEYSALERAEGDGPALSLVGLLSEPGEEFTGGQFVLTEQRPRAQSKPTVMPLRKGDAAIIMSGVKPVKGSRGVYRVVVRHGISRVIRGERVGFEVGLVRGGG